MDRCQILTKNDGKDKVIDRTSAKKLPSIRSLDKAHPTAAWPSKSKDEAYWRIR